MANPEGAGRELKKLRRLIKGIRVAMLTTVSSNGTLRSRPMATQPPENDGELWFFTRSGSPKTDEIRDNQRVNLSYADLKDNCFVSVSGSAQIVRDADKIKELWDSRLKAWFPLGKKDPELALLRVTIEQAEYWDAPSARLVQLVGFAKATLAGEAGGAPLTDHRKIDVEAPPVPEPTTRGGAQG